MKSFFLSALLLASIVTGCNNRNEKEPSVEKQVTGIGQLEFAYLDGQPVSRELFRGKTVFVNFWATWCKPCVAELPSLQRLVGKFSADSIVFLFASEEDAADINRFQQARGYTMTFVRYLRDAGLTVQGLPVTVIFDRNGTMVFSELGARAWDSEESVLQVRRIVQQP